MFPPSGLSIRPEEDCNAQQSIVSAVIHAAIDAGIHRGHRHIREGCELRPGFERQDTAEDATRRTADGVAEVAVTQQTSDRTAA